MLVLKRQSVGAIVEEKTRTTLKTKMKLNTVDVHLTTDGVFERGVVVEMQHLKALFNATELFYSHSVIFFLLF